MEYFYLLVLQYPLKNGYAISTRNGTYITKAGESRLTAFSSIEAGCIKDNRGLYGDVLPNTIFYSLEPNQLPEGNDHD